VIDVESANRSGMLVDEDAAVELARRVLGAEGVADGELGLSFVTPDEMRAMIRRSADRWIPVIRAANITIQ